MQHDVVELDMVLSDESNLAFLSIKTAFSYHLEAPEHLPTSLLVFYIVMT